MVQRKAVKGRRAGSSVVGGLQDDRADASKSKRASPLLLEHLDGGTRGGRGQAMPCRHSPLTSLSLSPLRLHITRTKPPSYLCIARRRDSWPLSTVAASGKSLEGLELPLSLYPPLAPVTLFLVPRWLALPVHLCLLFRCVSIRPSPSTGSPPRCDRAC